MPTMKKGGETLEKAFSKKDDEIKELINQSLTGDAINLVESPVWAIQKTFLHRHKYYVEPEFIKSMLWRGIFHLTDGIGLLPALELCYMSPYLFVYSHMVLFTVDPYCKDKNQCESSYHMVLDIMQRVAPTEDSRAILQASGLPTAGVNQSIAFGELARTYISAL